MRGNRGDLMRTALYVFLIWVGWLTSQVVSLWLFKIVFPRTSTEHAVSVLIVATGIALVGTVLVIFRKKRGT